MTTFERVIKCLEFVILTTEDGNKILQRDLGMDSLDFVEFDLALQQEFGIEIPDSFYENNKDITIKQVVELIDHLLQPDGN